MGKAIWAVIRWSSFLAPLLLCAAACGETAKHPADSAGGSAVAGNGGSSIGKAAQTGGSDAEAGAQTDGGALITAGAGGDNPAECPSDAIDLDSDPEHCGSCDVTCGAHGACVAGKCTADLITIADIPNCGTLALQIAPGNFAPQILYALATQDGAVYRTELPDTGDGVPHAITSKFPGATTFELSWGVLVPAGKSVTAVDLTERTELVLASDASTIIDATTNAGTGDILYTTSAGIKTTSLSELGASGSLIAASSAGSEPQMLVSWSNVVFYNAKGSNNIEVIRPPSDVPVVIAADQKGLFFGHRSLQSDDTYLYWANGSLQMTPLDDAAHPVSTIAHPIDNSAIIAFAVDSIDERIAYFATADGNFEKAKFDSKKPASLLARALPPVTSVVMDDVNVYLASGCTIFKSPRLVFDPEGG